MDEPAQDPPYHRRVYDPALGDAHTRIRNIEERYDVLEERVSAMEEDRRTALAVRDALAKHSENQWSFGQRFSVIFASFVGAIGTIVSLYVAIRGH